MDLSYAVSYHVYWAMFIQNTIIILLWDKLLPDFYHAFILSAAHIFLNYVHTEDTVWVLLWSVIFIGNMTISVHFMADVQPTFCENIDIALVDVTVKATVAGVIVICIADVDAMICIRCYSARW